MPAQARDIKRQGIEAEPKMMRIQETKLGIAEITKIFLGPNNCCRKPATMQITTGGISSSVPEIIFSLFPPLKPSLPNLAASR